jgi:hypothetical protein
MKGATTEPCASINKPPSINITMMIGASHSFLRERRNIQSSFINPILFAILELVFKGLRFDRFPSYNPVTWFLIKFQPQFVSSSEAHQ